MASSREIEIGTECECCRHFDHDSENDECTRCVACGEWCEGCNEVALLHDSGYCSDCCEDCTCGDESDDDYEEEAE